jgi:hypothetical protein
MSNPRAQLYDKVSGADIDAIAFQDPLRDETRKAKRNLVAAAFAAILIAALNLKVESFLGLKTADAHVLAAASTQGLACVAVIYFLVAFLLGFFVDYNAWRFEQERLLVKPYLELIKMAEQAFFSLTQQIGNAMHYLHGQPVELEKITDPVLLTGIRESRGQLQTISKGAAGMFERIGPFLQQWAEALQKSRRRLSWRLRARFASLWGMDFAVPIVLAALAVWKTRNGLPDIAARILA